MTMATFSNQITNLNTLAIALTNLRRQFKAPDSLRAQYNGKRNENDDPERRRVEAGDFLDSMIKRADEVDESLMKSTEHLLPTLSGQGDTSRMTATELNQMLSYLHGTHARQIQRLACMLGDTCLSYKQHAAKDTPTGEGWRSDEYPSSHWSLGMPLEKVVETDNETDRYSYGSVASVRSISFPNIRAEKSPETTLTLAINGLRVSECTVPSLTHGIQGLDSSEPNAKNWNSESGVGGNMSYVGGREAPKECHIEKLDQRNNHNNTKQKLRHAEGVSPLHHVYYDDNALGEECKPSANAMEKFNSSDTSPTGEGPLCSSTESGDDDDGEKDEVTTLCPTLVANGSFTGCIELRQQAETQNYSRKVDQEIVPKETDGFGRSTIFRTRHDISHIMVQTETSPSQTMLIMDATMFCHEDDANLTPSSSLANYGACLGGETPMLDRYRIMPDDSSIGFKVLPNERGPRRKQQVSPSRTTEAVECIPRSVQFRERSGVRGERASSRNTERIGSSPYLECDSTLNKENGGKGASLASELCSKPASDKQSRRIFQKTPLKNTANEGRVTNSVAFPFANNQLTLETRFGKSPHSRHTRSSGHGEEKVQMIPFETSNVGINFATPVKRRAKAYTKTPNPRIAERLSIESLKFSPGTLFPCNTTALTKTTFLKVSSDTGGPLTSFEHRPKELSALTPLRGVEAFLKSQYGSPLAWKGPSGGDVAEQEAQADTGGQEGSQRSPFVEIYPSRSVYDRPVASPFSLASTISSLTGGKAMDNQLELFPPKYDSSGRDQDNMMRSSSLPSARRSVSALIAKISEGEFEAGEVKQFSLDEANRAITALNGAAFLRWESGDPYLFSFSDSEAYKILRNVGFKRRSCKGILMALCHWGKLALFPGGYGLPSLPS